MRLATFDIFDTALLRKCGRPEVVPYLVAEKLFSDRQDLKGEYVVWREQAAAIAGNNATIKDIYSVEGSDSFTGYSSEDLMRAEMEMEAEMLAVNPAIKKKIVSFRSEGWTIKFLSDMYLPSDFLAEVLKREGCLKGDEDVIVSCEWKARKDNGSLYHKVKKRFNPKEWIHFGDNIRSDYKVARRCGVKATPVNSQFTAVENRVMQSGDDMRDGWRMKLLAGLSRYMRLKEQNESKAVLAADYVAPVYIPFVLYVLRQADRDKIKRLHFLSRDGYIMQKIAEAFKIEDIDLNYLFVSRKSLVKAFLAKDSENRFIRTLDKKTLISKRVNSMLKSLNLSREELKSAYGIEFEYSKIISGEQAKDFIEKIFHHPALTPTLLDRFGQDHEMVKAYLSQEGVTDKSVKQAMVDIGWLGTSRMMVNAIAENHLPTFYLGVRRDAYPRTCGDFYSYFALGQLDTSAPALIENYFSASPWPSTTGYRKAPEGIEPVFADHNKFRTTPVTETNERICCSLAEEIKPYLGILDDHILFKWAKISIDSISALKDPVDLKPLSEAGEFDETSMTRKLSLPELMNMLFTGARYTAFDRGSLALTLGHKWGSRCWNLHKKTARAREIIYHRFILKK